MSAKYKRTFVVAAPVERAWKAFADPEEREAWMGTPPPGTLEPGVIEILNSERHKSMSWAHTPSGLEGSYETSVTFEEESSGTRITIVRSGFGDSEDWRHYAENTTRGWDESFADLVLYLETGVRGGRHFNFRSGLGATALRSDAGVRITRVVPGGFAEHAGMKAGDLVLSLNGASVLTTADIAFLVREHAPGTEVDADYVRGHQVLHGRAALVEWNYGTGEYVGHPGGFPKPKLTGAQTAA